MNFSHIQMAILLVVSMCACVSAQSCPSVSLVLSDARVQFQESQCSPLVKYSMPVVQPTPLHYASRRVPLCPYLASMSYADMTTGHGKVVGKFTLAKARQLNITIQPLSSFEAEVIGPKNNIDYFVQLYPSLMCGFNSSLVINDEQAFSLCMKNVKGWMKNVEANESYLLMQRPSSFCNSCCSSRSLEPTGSDDATVGRARIVDEKSP